MRIFVSGDFHFYHKNIIKYCNRPFDINDENCVIDNAKMMIKRHNELVTNDDIIIFLGDLSAALRGRQKHFKELLKLLNGKKYLIRGNHDYESKKFYQSAGIIDVKEWWAIGKYFFCHYPCYTSRYTTKKEKRYVNKLKNYPECTHIIHGHIHDKDPGLWEPDGFTRLNTSVDFEPNNYYPIQIHDNTLLNYFL